MKNRHKVQKRASGGKTVHGGGNPNVIAEAEGKRRAHGGKAVSAADGKLSKMRLDRPGRKTGGRVGADKSPLSSANRDKGGTGADKGGPFEAPK